MVDIIGGLLLIGVGFALGGSVFMGNFDALNLVFDGLGILWIGKGIYKLSTRGSAPPPQR
ncbi:MAG: hypothetical protein AAB215_03935 [Planctomycetota bacterium]